MDLQEIVAGLGSSEALKSAAGTAGLTPEDAQGALQGVLEHVLQNGQAEGMIESVAGKAGISSEQVRSFLPHVLPLLQGHAENANEGVRGVLGSVIGSWGGIFGPGKGRSSSGI